MPLSSSVCYVEDTKVCLLASVTATAIFLLKLIKGVSFRDLLDDLCHSNQNRLIAMHAVDAEVVLFNSF